MIWIIIAAFVGLGLSAFFSGSETGFYRVTRVRLLVDALGGSLIADKLLLLTNNPSWFVATTLVGNNLANYITSLAIVLATERMFSGDSPWAEVLIPVAASPIVFIYGELLPKNLFYYAPNRLLRLAGLPFWIFAMLFSPISGLLWVLGQILERLVGQSPQQVQFRLARREVHKVLEEGQQAGILQPAQRSLAQSLVEAANEPVINFCTPVGRAAPVRLGTSTEEALRMAKRHRQSYILVRAEKSSETIGYVRVLDLRRENPATIDRTTPFNDIAADEKHIIALMRMQSEDETLVRVVDANGDTVGLLHTDQLLKPLFS